MTLTDPDNVHRRAEMRLVQRAIRGGWDIPENVLRAFPAEVIRVAIEKKDDGKYRYSLRERMRAIELVRNMLKDNRESEAAGLDGNADGVDTETLVRMMVEFTAPAPESEPAPPCTA